MKINLRQSLDTGLKIQRLLLAIQKGVVKTLLTETEMDDFLQSNLIEFCEELAKWQAYFSQAVVGVTEQIRLFGDEGLEKTEPLIGIEDYSPDYIEKFLPEEDDDK